jgi:hypothetical protein
MFLQVNEAQLAVSRPPASRYGTFKPSITATSADAPGLTYSRGHAANLGTGRAGESMPGSAQPTPFRAVGNLARAVPSLGENRMPARTPGMMSPHLDYASVRRQTSQP